MQPLHLLRSTFDRLKVFDSDLNVDVLLHQDVSRALDDLGIHPLHSALDEYLTSRDPTGSGCVTWSGFKEVYVAHYRVGMDPLTLAKRFRIIDRERRGFITRADLDAFLGVCGDESAYAWAVVSPDGRSTVSMVEYVMFLMHDADVAEVRQHASNLYVGTSSALRYNKVKKAKHATHLVVAPAPPAPPPPPQPAPAAEPAPPPPREPSPEPAAAAPAPPPPPPPKQEEKPKPKEAAPAAAAAPPPEQAKSAQQQPAAEPKKEGGCCIVA